MAIGLDFGTSNSAAIYDSGKGDLIFGVLDNVTPAPDSSTVWVNNQNQPYFGNSPTKPALYSSIKRLKWFLGNRTNICLDGRNFDPEDLSSSYLKWIRDRLEQKIGPEWNNGPNKSLVVASVPNRSWPGYRKRLRKCFEKAEFKNVRFVYEPTAAAVACLHEDGAFIDPGKVSGPVLVIDWGGGTLDVSLMELTSNGILVDINTEGVQSGIGGGDMDEWLARKAASENPDSEFAFNQLKRGEKNNVLTAVEAFKIRCISQLNNDLSCNAETITLPNSGQRKITVTEQHVRECVDFFCRKVQEVALRATSAAGVEISDVKHSIFVGGPFHSDFIRRNSSFQSWENARQLVYSQGPQFATAAGCALLARRGFEQRLACDIGVLEADGQFFSVAKRNEAFPANPMRWSEPIPIMNLQQFQSTDHACSEMLFEFGRTGGWGGIDNYIPLGRAQLPVAHTNGDLFWACINIAYLDSDLNFGVKLVGKQGRLHNGDRPEIEPTFDCLPIKTSLGRDLHAHINTP